MARNASASHKNSGGLSKSAAVSKINDVRPGNYSAKPSLVIAVIIIIATFASPAQKQLGAIQTHPVQTCTTSEQDLSIGHQRGSVSKSTGFHFASIIEFTG